jgi:hypothetical protein
MRAPDEDDSRLVNAQTGILFWLMLRLITAVNSRSSFSVSPYSFSLFSASPGRASAVAATPGEPVGGCLPGYGQPAAYVSAHDFRAKAVAGIVAVQAALQVFEQAVPQAFRYLPVLIPASCY